MKNKSMIKKIALSIILVVIIVVITVIAMNASSGKKQKNTNTTNVINKSSETENTKVEKEKKKTEVTELEDGIMYAVTNEKIEPEIVLKDTYFDTQIADIALNFNNYEGKTIQIEGLYFANNKYTFVGRYSTSNLCPDCPAGISYFEYEWHGDKEITLEDSKSWIKVIGTLRKGNDGTDYYYIDVANLEVMNEPGNSTVTN